MKLARFAVEGKTRLGRVEGDYVFDLTNVAPDLNGSMKLLIERLHELRSAIQSVNAPCFQLSEVRLLAPIDDPRKFLAIGMNYKAHAEEAAAAGIATPKSQLWFNKQVTCINGPFDDIVIPNVSEKVDYEAELGFVIGRRCRHVSREDARSVIAGYFVANDVTARDWQFRSPTYTLGKSFDTHGPIGPWITTDDEIADPHNLTLTLSLNGEERQRTSTGDMIYNIWDQISYLSTVMTLEPGDIIATGTPSNVGIATETFMKPGDVVRVEVSGLGAIENHFVAE
ncbi:MULTISPECIES: fumarylacetoacetate hydrolase family protein [Agrobacterium tumefaciens complex]|uniref:fumarylacetoacetate hydrolase family protein n=1 Tax=Agrobacterium tumefaciens complex TaxID=1183400 RepID=UPI0011F3784D|nr:fumarylacetoacetate hydrolase family protein [Agrobacterium tumefaciens]KAA1233939.1 fumarylacetoacetate hydrolase family protein [Agrobacterium tumefaciens]MCW8059159.1 fumarylacetoacetate hydrolase family protein [Agrobacterium tumefaciens]MCW8147266.1 fumarylacetoacetate hydrolase family protein [Agrobacterium tumefaciens]MQB37542.1 FAA hydrolase family protein [Agrobacterium tumefaciens]NSX87455.1 fumarylacetoacetate hydrolase family protein [Agrobacterium tumefaciens]